MAGSVYQLPGEKGWRVQVDAGTDPGTGRRARVKLPGRGKAPFPTKRQAEEAAARVMLERGEGRVVDSRYSTLGQFLTSRWLPARRARGLKPTTLASYEWIVEAYIIPRLGATKLTDLRAHHVTTMLVGLANEPGRGGTARSARTVQLTHRVLSMALGDAVRWKLITSNPAEAAEADLPRPKGQKRAIKTWATGQLRTFLLSVEEDRLYGLWLLAATTGMRRGELCGLEWKDVDLDAGRLTVRTNRVMVRGRAVAVTPKTDAGERTISLDPVTVEALRDRKRQEHADQLACPPGQWRECGNVFRDALGRPVFPESVSKRFRVLAQGAGLPLIRLHDVRHSYATAVREAGEDIEVLSERLGHSSSAVTRAIYIHPVEGLDRGMAMSIANLILGERNRSSEGAKRSSQPLR